MVGHRSTEVPGGIQFTRLSVSSVTDLVELDQESSSTPWTQASFTKGFDDPSTLFFGAVRDGRLIGFVSVQLAVDEAQIINIVVKAGERRLGTGRSLLSFALGEIFMRGGRWITLEVRSGNSAAISLYHSLGFSSVGRRNGYYNDNESALILGLNLRRFVEGFSSRLFQAA